MCRRTSGSRTERRARGRLWDGPRAVLSRGGHGERPPVRAVGPFRCSRPCAGRQPGHGHVWRAARLPAQRSGCPCAECSRNHGCDGRRGGHAGSIRRRARIGAPRVLWRTPEKCCKRASEASETRGVPVKMLVCMRKMLLTLGEGKRVRNASEVRQKQHESVRRTSRHCAPAARRACGCCARA